ncbi:MAG: hypothetical protein M1827_005853 [Pycnora praestabilis]|nr:MAG: hypothetical protein M1827_005853 [Pycnora praestabilis]
MSNRSYRLSEAHPLNRKASPPLNSISSPPPPLPAVPSSRRLNTMSTFANQLSPFTSNPFNRRRTINACSTAVTYSSSSSLQSSSKERKPMLPRSTTFMGPPPNKPHHRSNISTSSSSISLAPSPYGWQQHDSEDPRKAPDPSPLPKLLVPNQQRLFTDPVDMLEMALRKEETSLQITQRQLLQPLGPPIARSGTMGELRESSTGALRQLRLSVGGESAISELGTGVGQITQAQPTSYWCGRFSSLNDRIRNKDPDAEARDRDSCRGRSGHRTKDPEELRARRIFFELKAQCTTPEAQESLLAFHEIYYHKTGHSPFGATVVKKKSLLDKFIGKRNSTD